LKHWESIWDRARAPTIIEAMGVENDPRKKPSRVKTVRAGAITARTNRAAGGRR
jgi:hypothetical protein